MKTDHLKIKKFRTNVTLKTGQIPADIRSFESYAKFLGLKD